MIIRTDTDKSEAIEEIQALNLSKPWKIDIEPYKKNRSLSANKLYWKWITLIGDELGYLRDEMHTVLAMKFLEPVTVEWNGEQVVSAKSTSSLNVKEFTDYLNQIEIFASQELGLSLPHPEDTYYDALNRRLP